MRVRVFGVRGMWPGSNVAEVTMTTSPTATKHIKNELHTHAANSEGTAKICRLGLEVSFTKQPHSVTAWKIVQNVHILLFIEYQTFYAVVVCLEMFYFLSKIRTSNSN